MISLAKFSVGPTEAGEARLGKATARPDDRDRTTAHLIELREETCAVFNGVTVHDRLLPLMTVNAGHESATNHELASLDL